MKLTEMHTAYGSDKGLKHNYIDEYERILSSKRTSASAVLEIGVLLGNSLRMWNDYFQNAQIFGIDDFSQKDGHEHHNFKPVIPEDIIRDLSIYTRIQLGIFNSCDDIKCQNFLKDVQLDIIIDDGDHSENVQLRNIEIYSKFLKPDGIYIIEDIISYDVGQNLIYKLKTLLPGKHVFMCEFNIIDRLDDRLVIAI